MTFVPVMFSVWGALVLLFIVLKMYASRLGRDEEDQHTECDDITVTRKHSA